MWDILEHKSIENSLKSVPKNVRINYEYWKTLVANNGPQILKQFKGFHDEKLQGKRKLQRSSRLNKQYRVIYQVNELSVEVYVLEVNAHNY